MKQRIGVARFSALCALAAVCLSTRLSYAAVTADPGRVNFTNTGQSVTIALSANGTLLQPAAILDWQLIASGHDYKHMLTLETVPGGVKISPSGTLEVGSYDLRINTSQGVATVQVFAPLSDLPDVVENLSALTQLSEERIKLELGLATVAGREEIQIDLPPVYYEGQTLALTLPVSSDSGRPYAWFVNGERIIVDPSQPGLTYTFSEAGDYYFTYLETEPVDGQVAPIVRASARTRVVPVPGIATEIDTNAAMKFTPPDGYEFHVWNIDGHEVSRDATYTHTFTQPGVYVVECLASTPSEGPSQGYHRTRYITTVNAR